MSEKILHIISRDSQIKLLTESLDATKLTSIVDLKEELKNKGLTDFIIVENKDNTFEILRILKG